MIINALMALLVAELRADDIPDPLLQEFPLYAVWSDLARLANAPLPAEVAALLDSPALDRVIVPDHPLLAEPYRVAELEPA